MTIEQQHALGIDLGVGGTHGPVHLEHLPALGAVPPPAHLLAVLEDDAHVDGEHTVLVPACDDRRVEAAAGRGLDEAAAIAVADDAAGRFLPAGELADPVVECRGAPVDAIEEPGEVATAHLVGDGEEVLWTGCLNCTVRSRST